MIVEIRVWKCINCKKVREFQKGDGDQLFEADREFCSARCKREYLRRYRYVPQGQGQLFQV